MCVYSTILFFERVLFLEIQLQEHFFVVGCHNIPGGIHPYPFGIQLGDPNQKDFYFFDESKLFLIEKSKCQNDDEKEE